MAAPVKVSQRDDLSLKVIRLSKPVFQQNIPFVCESEDAAYQIMRRDPSQANPFGISSVVTIPSLCGKTFVGETFSSYISINNGSTHNVTNVSIQVLLKTPKGSRSILDVAPGSIPVFSPGDSQDFVVSQEIGEEGTYKLICLGSYIRHDGEGKKFKKYVQFDVEQPLQVSFKTHLVQNKSFVEVEVKNTSSVTFCIESIRFIAEETFSVENMNEGIYEGDKATKGDLSHSLIWLKHGQVRQYLYNIVDVETKANQYVGHLEIDWKSNTGGNGKITTPKIKRPLPRQRDFSLQITNIPPRIELEIPFKVTCVIKNCSSQKLIPRLCATVEKQVGITINGISGRTLGVLAPGASVSTEISLFPLFPGIQYLNGLRIVEQTFDKKFDFDEIVDLLVESC